LSGAEAASGSSPSQGKGARSFSLFQTRGNTKNETLAAATILLVEDNPADVLLVREALEEHQVRADVYVISDGEKAVRFVDEEAKDLPSPDLIILDLNLPRKSGREVLEHIRASDRMGKVRVVVLSSSDAPKDMEESFRLGIAKYIRKPSSLSDFMKIGGVLRALLEK
jgi:two-component system response regulator